MKIGVVKYLNLVSRRVFRPPLQNVLRMSGCDKPPEPCPCKPPEPCAPPPPPPSTASSCPDPPPCAPMPLCPPTICPPVVDSNNPCNYCPPPCIDPDAPDLTRLKKLQCYYQKHMQTPVFLIKGKSDVFLYQLTWVLTIVSTIGGYYTLFSKMQL